MPANFVVFVVRVVTDRRTPPELEQLVRDLAELDLVVMHRDDDHGMCFDFLPPTNTVDTSAWALEAAHHLEQAGWNAVRAPKWKEADHA